MPLRSERTSFPTILAWKFTGNLNTFDGCNSRLLTRKRVLQSDRFTLKVLVTFMLKYFPILTSSWASFVTEKPAELRIWEPDNRWTWNTLAYQCTTAIFRHSCVLENYHAHFEFDYADFDIDISKAMKFRHFEILDSDSLLFLCSKYRSTEY